MNLYDVNEGWNEGPYAIYIYTLHNKMEKKCKIPKELEVQYDQRGITV